MSDDFSKPSLAEGETNQTASPAAKPHKKTKMVRAGWGPISAVLLGLTIFLGVNVVVGVVFSLVPLLFGKSLQESNDLLSHPYGVLFFSLVCLVIVVGLIFLFVRRRGGLRALGIDKLRAGYVLQAALALVVYYLLYIILLLAAKSLIPALDLEQNQQLGLTDPVGNLQMIAVFVSLVIFPPIVEEVAFRGFMYGGLRSKLSFVPAAIITSVLFAAGHLQLGTGAALLWVAAIDTFVLSMVMCWLREKTGSIWPAIWLHAFKNGLAFVFLFLVK